MARAKKRGTAARRPRMARGGRRKAAGDVVGTLQAALAELRVQRDAIERQMGSLESTLREFGGVVAAAPGRRGPGRPRGGGPRPGSLKDFIQRALSGGEVMAVKDIADAVIKAGFETSNQTLAKSVGIALTQMPNVAKVGRGRFKVK